MSRLRSLATSVAIGLVLAGPVAAIAVVSLPEDWRMPAVPYATAVGMVALVAWVRWPRQPPD